MKDGFIQQIGTPQEVFDHPANIFVAGFIGMPQMNFFDARLEKTGESYVVKCQGATITPSDKIVAGLKANNVGSKDVVLGVRPVHISFAAKPDSTTIKGTVDVSEMMGSEVHLHVNADGKDVVLVVPTTDLPEEHRSGIRYGTEVHFTFRNDLIHLFDVESEKNLL